MRLDLGLRGLIPEWRAIFRAQYLREDLIAALTVACIAVPLSLAIALASGVPPATGLVTAIVGGIVCALFGGTTLAVSGPAAAMAVLCAAIVHDHGMGGLLVAGFLCGSLQLLTGMLGLGKFIRLVPMPVVEGFTAGIGALILIGQLPRALGLPPPAESQVINELLHIRELSHRASPMAVLVAVSTLALVFGLPRIHPKLPAPLFAVAVPTLVVALTGVDVAVIGSIPSSLPLPHLPAFPQASAFGPLLTAAFTVYALGSLESLLSASAVDKLARGSHHDPDQELIGQGLGNLASAALGGLPVTSVIARSALNVQAGARTRRSAILHAIALVGVVFLFAGMMARIPIAALAGVLVAVALRMLNPRKLIALARISRGDAAVHLTTFAVIVFTDLLLGVQWGIMAALAVAAVRLGHTRTQHLPGIGAEPTRLVLGGPLTFLSSLKLERLRGQIADSNPGSAAVLDLSTATTMDSSGAELIVDLVGAMKERGLRIAILGAQPDLAKCLHCVDPAGVLEGAHAKTEQDVPRVLRSPPVFSGRQRLFRGVERYRKEHLPRYVALFARLADGQKPHTLLITCSDSRIQPSLLTCTEPGELFIVRNVGNMVPPYSMPVPPSSGAGLEYAVGILGVSEIVVCGHSRCGAIYALRHPDKIPAELRTLRSWLSESEARSMCEGLPTCVSDDDVARLNTLLQIEHLRTHPLVRARIEAHAIKLHAWFFDVASGQIEEWVPEEGTWRSLTCDAPNVPLSKAILSAGTNGAPRFVTHRSDAE